MPRILLIENDSGFAGDLARVLAATGYETQVVGEGREGLARATAWRPDGIVLSVELPDMSGYLVCQRLRKDDALRTIPLVLTSADATEKSFADHQKLKVRADAYLLKPYPPQTLLESLAHLVPLPEGGGIDEEELVRLEDGAEDGLPPLELNGLGDEAPRSPAPLHDDVPAPARPARDEDDLFLDSLMGLGDETPSAAGEETLPVEPVDEALADSGLELNLDDELERSDLGGELGELGGDLGGELDRPVQAEDLDAAADSLPDASRDPLEALGGFGDRGSGALGDLSEEDEKTQSEPLRPAPVPAPEPKVRAASADLLRAAGIKLLGDDEEDEAPFPSAPTPPPVRTTRQMPAIKVPRPGPAAALPELDDLSPPAAQPLAAPAPAGGIPERLERELADTRQRLSDARAEILSRESEVRQLKDKVGAATRRAEQAEAQVREARTEAGDASELRERLAAAERRAEDAARARAEAERRAAEAERRTAEATARADGAEAAARARAEEDAAAARDLEALRAELASARTDAEAVRAELARAKAQPAGPASAELEKRVAELEAANAKNEERVLKAYQKIRGDEKVRDKVRKALAIASQLLDEGMAPDPGERERRPPAPAPKL